MHQHGMTTAGHIVAHRADDGVAGQFVNLVGQNQTAVVKRLGSQCHELPVAYRQQAHTFFECSIYPGRDFDALQILIVQHQQQQCAGIRFALCPYGIVNWIGGHFSAVSKFAGCLRAGSRSRQFLGCERVSGTACQSQNQRGGHCDGEQ